jgi:hypothetical protein
VPASCRQLQVLLLSLLFVWSGLANAHHAESQENGAASQTSASFSKMTPGQDSSQAHCDECCHGGGHFETVSNDPAPALPIARAPLQATPTLAPPSCLLPPPTPPPQR